MLLNQRIERLEQSLAMQRSYGLPVETAAAVRLFVVSDERTLANALPVRY
jgi:hypothetical protein